MLTQGEFWIIENEKQLGAVVEFLQQTKFDGGPICVKIEKSLPARTELQNRFLWGWVYYHIEKNLEDGGIVIKCDDDSEMPYTKDVLHEIFKRKFLIKQVIESKGRSIEIFRSTTELSTKEFCDFVKKVEEFIFQFWKITIPKPTGAMLKIWTKWLNEK
jgi:hypothetical protein